MDPPCTRGYRLDIYDQLIPVDNTMVYEVKKPFDSVPYTIIVHPFEDHLAFFHTLWNLDEFDVNAADRHFMMRVWNHLCPERGPWRPALYDICIDEDHEPAVYRMAAAIYLMERFYVSESDRINQCIGRFCMFSIVCLNHAFLYTPIHVLWIFPYWKPTTLLLTKSNLFDNCYKAVFTLL
jgi:hypothetical protein